MRRFHTRFNPSLYLSTWSLVPISPKFDSNHPPIFYLPFFPRFSLVLSSISSISSRHFFSFPQSYLYQIINYFPQILTILKIFCRFKLLMAASRRASQLGSITRTLLFPKSRTGYNFTAVPPENYRRLDINYRQISQLQVRNNGKRAFLVDTLAVVRSLEKEGIPSQQAEAITSAITGVLNDTLENVSYSFVSKGEMQKTELIQEGNISKFKTEVQSSQNHHFALLQRETEKLQGDIEKLQRELKYEIDKVTAGQRLDLNLEKGRIREELNNQKTETSDLTNKLDREIHALRAQLEAAKYEVIKYCIGSLVSISAVGLAVIRILL